MNSCPLCGQHSPGGLHGWTVTATGRVWHCPSEIGAPLCAKNIADPPEGRVTALLPCPHCGEADELYPAHLGMGGGKPYAIDCLGCGADFTPRAGTDVIAAWNRRAAAASPHHASDEVPGNTSENLASKDQTQ